MACSLLWVCRWRSKPLQPGSRPTRMSLALCTPLTHPAIGTRQMGAPAAAPSAAAAPARAHGEATQPVPVTLVVEQTDSRYPGAQRVDVRRTAKPLMPPPVYHSTAT